MYRVAAVVFEGGEPPASEVEVTLRGIRRAIVRDTVDLLAEHRGISQVIVATNYPDLQRELAGRRGVRTWETGGREPFVFGDVLRAIVRECTEDAILCLSGTAAPLLRLQDVDWIVAALREGNRVVVNNPLSADIVAYRPASALEAVASPLAEDNFLGYELRQAGLERILMPESPHTAFDLDTPADALLLSALAHVGRRTSEALEASGWRSPVLEEARSLLAEPWRELLIVGRVAPGIVDFINQNLRCRVRVVSEERGMKALGRDRRGEVVSLFGWLTDALGPGELLRRLGRACDLAFIDTRVLFAHWGVPVSDADRFNSDLGRWREISDPRVREFTRAATEATVPVVLGGHTLVHAGLRLLATEAVDRQGAGTDRAAAGRKKFRGST